MTTSKYEESIKELSSPDEAKRLKALRFIKNSVIGNVTKKDLFIKLGVVQRLVEHLMMPDDSSYQLKIQAVTILGSMAYGKDENVTAVVDAGAVGPLLNALSLPENLPNAAEAVLARHKLIEATTRSLKAIFSSSRVCKDDVFTDRHLYDLLLLLDTSAAYLAEHSTDASSDALSFSIIAESIAAILAKCCETQDHQTLLASANAIKPLVSLLHSGYINAQEAAMDALATLCRENNELARVIVNTKEGSGDEPMTDMMLEFVKNSKCPTIQLLAATCLTNLYRAGAFAEPAKHVLPVLVSLLRESTGDIQWRAPLVLADLIKDSEDMQMAAFETDAIPRLADLLISVSPKEGEDANETRLGIPGIGSMAKHKEKIRENSLVALAAATLFKEDCRKQAIEAKVLPHVVSALQSKQPNVRLAACQCTKSLSRSVCNLRTNLVDAGVSVPLIKLLQDDSLIVQAAACGALCNMILEFSPMKKNVIRAGALEKFVEYSQSSEPKLQLNGVWAINSFVYKADASEKRALMKVLSYDSLLDLLHDSSPKIQEQALEVVRNLVCGPKEVINEVIEGLGKEDLLDVLESKLDPSSLMDLDEEDNAIEKSILEVALYAVVNLSSGPDEAKDMLVYRPNILFNVVRHLSHEVASIREAAVWCIINWTTPENDYDPAARTRRLQKLRELEVDTKLAHMKKDPSRDVRGRVGHALDYFVVNTGDPMQTLSNAAA